VKLDVWVGVGERVRVAVGVAVGVGVAIHSFNSSRIMASLSVWLMLKLTG
jgi:hypothetical protein